MITRDPCTKAAFFLSLIGGPKVEGWIQRTYDWLDDIEADPSLLSFKMNTWQALEAKFKKAFIDYAAHERAQDKLRKLKMKEGNIDEYISAF
jgi:Retrotransposon gag protein